MASPSPVASFPGPVQGLGTRLSPGTWPRVDQAGMLELFMLQTGPQTGRGNETGRGNDLGLCVFVHCLYCVCVYITLHVQSS